MSLATKLALGLGSKIDGGKLDTKKSSKKNPKKEEKTFLLKKQHQLVFSFERRNGKPITIVGKFQVENETKKEILKLLKTQLACGGSIKGENIEIQGELKEKVRRILVDNGWKFKN